MRRIYGVITDRASASEFLNKLYEACMYVDEFTGTDGKTSIDTNKFPNPVQMISDYSYLENMSIGARAEAMNALSRAGIINEAITGSAEAKVFSDLTKGVVNVPTDAEVAKFADNLYLGVLPIDVDDGDGSAHLTRIKIYQFYTEEVTTTQEVETVNEETGETETTETTTTETITHQTTFNLGHSNSNTNAPAVAYEMTTAYSGDVLVKLAWCTTSCPSTEQELKHVFSSLSICQYFARVEDAGHAGAYIKFEHGGGNHTDIVFGASGPVGGFLLHTMKTQINGSQYAITVFNNGDRTPLYSWSAGSGSWDILDTTKSYAVNINVSGYGRIISKETYGSNDTPVVAMSALAPIFTPAIDDIAESAKWMPQGPYDYSYFDNSGHIAMEKGNNPSIIFLADHGIYLYDGEWGDKWSTDGLETPDSSPIDMVNIKRPEPSSWLPYSGRFYAIFDCKDGLSRTGWFNTKENGEAYDMTFVGSPTINADGSARFENNPTSQNSAWCNADYGKGNNYNGSIMIAVMKFNNLTAWGNATRDRDSWLAFLFGYVPSQNDRSSFNDDEYSGMSQRTYSRDSGYYNNIICDAAGSWYHYNGNRHDTTIDPDAWYIFILSPDAASNSTDCELYKIKSDGTVELVSTFNHRQGYNVSGAHLMTRFYIGSYNGGDTSWRTTPAQIGRVWENTQTTWATYASLEPPRISVDFKFVALSDTSNLCWRYWNNGGTTNKKNEILSEIANRYKE